MLSPRLNTLKVVPTSAMSLAKLIGRVWTKTSATHYHAQFELPDKGRAIKELVAYWVSQYPGCLYRKGEIDSPSQLSSTV